MESGEVAPGSVSSPGAKSTLPSDNGEGTKEAKEKELNEVPHNVAAESSTLGLEHGPKEELAEDVTEQAQGGPTVPTQESNVPLEGEGDSHEIPNAAADNAGSDGDQALDEEFGRDVQLSVAYMLDTLESKDNEATVDAQVIAREAKDGNSIGNAPEVDGSKDIRSTLAENSTQEEPEETGPDNDEHNISNEARSQQREEPQTISQDNAKLNEAGEHFEKQRVPSKSPRQGTDVVKEDTSNVGDAKEDADRTSSLDEEHASRTDDVTQVAEDAEQEEALVEEDSKEPTHLLSEQTEDDRDVAAQSPSPQNEASKSARLSVKRKWNKKHYASPRTNPEGEPTETNHSHKWELDERNHAASVIQGAYRAALQRFPSSANILSDQSGMESSAVEIQRIYRGYIQRRIPLDPYFEESVDHTIAAIEIQRAVRGRLAREHVQTRRRKRFAATGVQRLVRGRQTRRNFQKERENEAALRAQQRIRIYQAKQRKQALEREREKQRDLASKTIQKEIRRFLNSSVADSGAQNRSSAASAIQARFRGYQTRETMRARHAAASRVQAQVRGHQERKIQQYRNECATRAQACVRGHKERSARNHANHAATCIQRQCRGRISRRDMAERQHAATIAQANFRGYQSRKHVLEVSRQSRAATEIQRTLRGHQCREWLSYCNRSAVNMQRLVRGHQHRCICQTRVRQSRSSESMAKTNTFVTSGDSPNSYEHYHPSPKLESTALAITPTQSIAEDKGVQTESKRQCCEQEDIRCEASRTRDPEAITVGIDHEGQVRILPELRHVEILVGMRKFKVLMNVFMRYPHSLIGRILSGQESGSSTRESYLEFRRSGKLFQHILDFYYNRELSIHVRQDEVLRAAVEAEALYFDLHSEMFVPESSKPVVIRKNFERWLRLNGNAVQFQVRPHERLEVVSVQGSGVLLMNLIANDAEVIPEATVFDTASIIPPETKDKIHLDTPPYPGGDDFMYSFIVAPCVQPSNADGAAWLKVEFSIHISV